MLCCTLRLVHDSVLCNVDGAEIVNLLDSLMFDEIAVVHKTVNNSLALGFQIVALNR